MLEDSLHGIQAGIAAGCYTCAIPSEYTLGQDFSGATLIAQTLGSGAIKEFILQKKPPQRAEIIEEVN